MLSETCTRVCLRIPCFSEFVSPCELTDCKHKRSEVRILKYQQTVFFVNNCVFIYINRILRGQNGALTG